MVLALIFGLYQDCEGQQTSGNAGRFTTGGQADEDAKGMKLSDIREALSCCVCSAADEVAVTECADRVVQELFEGMQSKGLRVDSITDDNDGTMSTMSGLSEASSRIGQTARASVMLSHGALSSMAQVEVVSQDDFTRVILEHREVYEEFARQLLRFRGLVAHFAHVGSVPYAKAKRDRSIYGTQSFS